MQYNNTNNQEVNSMNTNTNNNTNNAQEVAAMENNVNNMKTFVKLINDACAAEVTIWFEQAHVGKAFAAYFEEVFEDAVYSNIVVHCDTGYMPHAAIREVKGTNEHLTMLNDEVGYVYECTFDIMVADMVRIVHLLNGILAGTEYSAYIGTAKEWEEKKRAGFIK